MSETSWPTAGGGSVTDASYEFLMGAMTGDGLVGTPALTSLVYADSTGRQVKLRTARYAIVRGFIYYSGAQPTILPVTANSSGKARVDRVVLRLDRNTFTVRAVVIAGTPASAPTAPAYVQTMPPGRYFDLPVATVTVPSGATGIGSGNVVHTGWYLAEPPLTGTTASFPASAPGRIYRDATRKRTYIGMETSGWQTLSYDSGWLALKAPANWAGTLQARQKNGWCTVNVGLRWTGSTIAKTSKVLLYTLGSSFRPSAKIFSTVVIGNPDGARTVTVDTAGKITIDANGTAAINKNSTVSGTVVYPVNG